MARDCGLQARPLLALQLLPGELRVDDSQFGLRGPQQRLLQPRVQGVDLGLPLPQRPLHLLQVLLEGCHLRLLLGHAGLLLELVLQIPDLTFKSLHLGLCWLGCKLILEAADFLLQVVDDAMAVRELTSISFGLRKQLLVSTKHVHQLLLQVLRTVAGSLQISLHTAHLCIDHGKLTVLPGECVLQSRYVVHNELHLDLHLPVHRLHQLGIKLRDVATKYLDCRVTVFELPPQLLQLLPLNHLECGGSCDMDLNGGRW
mmetsp:Transcript_124932/g.216574  ORF Transcript_124932/g.216574 Transcript_124932/m.216574 type:complete len:258 (-) Transcript_124932:345-1118(-)